MVQLEKTQEVSSQIQKPKIEVCKIEFNQKILEVLKKHNISPNQIEKYIPLLQNYKLELDDLNKKLEIITLTAKINCPDESENIIATMYSTSSGFKGLEEKLFRNLLSENISKIVGDLSFNSQALIDVLVRNLFERTADVGVLSKDKDIINFLQTKDNTGLSQKLKSYVSKYSVYDDVLIFDENGQLSGSINNYDGEKILDRELFEKIKNSDTFEEVYYSKNQVTNKENALMFYQKIVDENNKFLGVLALSFDFSGEIKKLFQNLSKDNDKSIKLLLSKDGNVIFSSDENIKTGTNLKFSPNSLYEIIKIGSTDYIAVSNQANEYEGFKGLGSIGAILLPLDKAFESENLNVDLNDDILATASSLCPELNSILESAGVVNRDLSRVVWNGEIISTHSQDNEILRPILRDISKTGDDIQSTIAKAINSLYSVVLRGSLKRALNIATLMADIMDRNLYERANDVRWWALINELIIAIGNNDIKKIDEILSDTNFRHIRKKRVAKIESIW